MWHVKSTRATLTKTIEAGAKSISIDFSDALLFPEAHIQEASCTFYGTSPTGYAVDTSAVGTLGVTFSSMGAQTNITCTVDQSKRTQPGH